MSESQLSDLFDESIENGLKRIGYGLLAGLGAGLVLASALLRPEPLLFIWKPHGALRVGSHGSHRLLLFSSDLSTFPFSLGSNMVRAGVVGLSVGVGLGMTYAETQNRFEALSASSEDVPTDAPSTPPTETIQEAPSSNESSMEGS